MIVSIAKKVLEWSFLEAYGKNREATYAGQSVRTFQSLGSTPVTGLPRRRQSRFRQRIILLRKLAKILLGFILVRLT